MKVHKDAMIFPLSLTFRTT